MYGYLYCSIREFEIILIAIQVFTSCKSLPCYKRKENLVFASFLPVCCQCDSRLPGSSSSRIINSWSWYLCQSFFSYSWFGEIEFFCICHWRTIPPNSKYHRNYSRRWLTQKCYVFLGSELCSHNHSSLIGSVAI